MDWANWFSKRAADAQDAAAAAALKADAEKPLAGGGTPAVPAAPAVGADPFPYDDQVLQAGWIAAERVDATAAEHPPATASGEDALQDALAFLSRVYNNQGC